MARAKPKYHPLLRVFWSRCFSELAGLNWLQDRGHISDECVTLADVAPCDVERVVMLWRERWAVKAPPEGWGGETGQASALTVRN